MGRSPDHRREWNRFLIRSRNFQDAARLAANRGWWLHCWNWEPSGDDSPVVEDTWNGNRTGAQTP